MLRLVLGRAGSGKTHYALTDLAARAAVPGQASRCLLLVPEQFSFETERFLLQTMGPRAASEIKVYSFTRLAEMVARELGGIAGKTMDEATRVVLMSEALSQVNDRLTVYRRRGTGDAQIALLLPFEKECKQGGISPRQLEQAANMVADESLRRKLQDTAWIFGAFEALAAQSYIDPQDALGVLADRLPESRWIRDTYIYVDGFKGFTAQELRVLGVLMEKAAEITVTLCTDTLQEGDTTDLFYVPTHTAGRLLQMAKERGVKTAAPLYLTENHRHTTAGLRHLEQWLFRPEKPEEAELAADVTVTACSQRYSECDYAVRVLRRLMREKGLRCREAAIVVRSLSDYDGVLDVALEKAGIPYYIDDRENLLNDTLVITLLSALQCLGGGFRTEDILRLLKTGLLGFSTHSVALLETYAYRWGIQGVQWRRPWKEHPDGMSVTADETTDRRLAYLNRLRHRVIAPLEELDKALAGHPTGETFARALYTYLKTARVDRLVRLQVARLDAAGETALADRADRVWDTVMDLLDTFAAALKATPANIRHWTELFRQAAAATDLGSIPQQLDAVQIGSADRMRFSAPKAVLILGANEGCFPAVPVASGVLSDRDRQQLAAVDLPLGDTGEQMLSEERFFAYAAMTAPSKHLYVSYLLGNTAGETLSPSVLVREVETLLPRYIRGEEQRADATDLEYAEDVFSRISGGFGEGGTVNATLREVLSEDSVYAEKLCRLEEAVRRKPVHFENKEMARRLFGNDMVLSPTRVDTFYQCRFRYFCRYGMRVTPLRKADLSALEFGQVVHYIMQHQLPLYIERGLQDITSAQAEQDASYWIGQYAEEFMGGTEGKPARFLYLLSRVARLGGRLLWRVVCELKQSRFVPVDYELPLTARREEEGLPAMTLKLPDGSRACVVGTIDRVDVYHSGDTAYVRVVDYKTGSKDFLLSDVVEGLNLQMLIYMCTIWQNGGPRYGTVTPAGMLYLPSKLPVLEVTPGMDAEEAKNKQLRMMKMNGLLLDNPEVLRAMEPSLAGVFIPAGFTKNGTPTASSSLVSLRQMGLLKKKAEALLQDMVELLHEGEVGAMPAYGNSVNACQYCDYRAVCGFEEGDAQREIPSFSAKEVLAKLDKEESTD